MISKYGSKVQKIQQTNPDEIKITFFFDNGTKIERRIDVSGEDPDIVQGYLDELQGKQKLLQNVFEHGTFGQISVQGLTVNAAKLTAMEIS